MSRATASSASASRSASPATRPPRSCARSSSAPSSARPSTTWSPTACPSPSRSPLTEPDGGRDPSRPPVAITGPKMIELTAKTKPGARLVRTAEALAQDFASRAALHDREASFPHAAIDALKRAGYFTAPIPVECGGLGVTSVHDVVVASSRLARGDASIAIGVNMHLVLLLNIVRRWQAAAAASDRRRATAFAASMNAIARDGVVMASAVSELGQDLTRPQTTATRTPSGWRVDGRKAFCTMSPAATVLSTAVTFVDDDGIERYGYAQVPTDAGGVEIHDDWDALGMRASGSHSVTFADVAVPHSALRGGFVAGDADAYMERNLLAGLFHASASLGIAESAASAATAAASRRGEPDARTRML